MLTKIQILIRRSLTLVALKNNNNKYQASASLVFLYSHISAMLNSTSVGTLVFSLASSLAVCIVRCQQSTWHFPWTKVLSGPLLEHTQVEISNAYYHVGNFSCGWTEAVWMHHSYKKFFIILYSLASNWKVKINQKAALTHVNTEGFRVPVAD